MRSKKYPWWMITISRVDVLGKKRKFQEIYCAENKDDLLLIRPLRRGEKLLKISRVTGFSAWAESMRNRVDQNLVNFALGECADLLEGGMPVGEAVQMQLRRTKNPIVRYHFLNVVRTLAMGVPLSKAFAREKEICDPGLEAIMHVAQETGELTGVLKELRVESEYTSYVRRQITSMMIYPYALLWAFFGVTMIFAVKITPEIVKFYQQFKASLPWYSIPHYKVAAILGKFPWTSTVLAVAILASLPFLRHRFADAKITRARMYSSPRLGVFLARNELVIAISQVAIALQAGLQLQAAMELTVGIFKHPAMKEAWKRIIYDITNGIDASKAFEAYSVEFGDLGEELAAVVRIGEAGKHGELKVHMKRFAERLRADMLQRVRDLEKQMSPVITVTMMLCAAGILLPFQVPMLRMGILIAPKPPKVG